MRSSFFSFSSAIVLGVLMIISPVGAANSSASDNSGAVNRLAFQRANDITVKSITLQKIGVTEKSYADIRNRHFKGISRSAYKLPRATDMAAASTAVFIDDCNEMAGCTSDENFVDLGVLGVWEYGDYMYDRGFWDFVVADAYNRPDPERHWQCREKLNGCLSFNRKFKAAATGACSGLAAGGLIGVGATFLCVWAVEEGTERAENECYEEFPRCVYP